MLRLKVALAVMFLVGAAASVLSVTGSGGHIPVIPLVLGIAAVICGATLTALMTRGPRKSSPR